MIGIRFEPGGLFDFTQRPLSEIVDSVDRIESLFGENATNLVERLLSTSNIEAQVEILNRALLERAPARMSAEARRAKEADGTARINPVYMRVDVEKGTMVISGSPDFSPDSFLTGTATMQGEPWNWNVLRFDMQFKTPRGAVTIKDSNWVVGDLLIARKEILAPNGTPVQLWEVEAQAVTQAEFEAKRISAGCPAFE